MENKITILDFIKTALPLLQNHIVNRLDKDLESCKICIYWVNTVLRIDIKMKPTTSA